MISNRHSFNTQQTDFYPNMQHMQQINSSRPSNIGLETSTDNSSNDYDENDLLKKRITQTIIDIIVIVIVFIIFGIVYLTVNPKILYFTCDQSDIFMPYKADTVPLYAVGIFATLGPLIVIIIVEIINGHVLPCVANKKKNSCKKLTVCLIHAISLFVLGIAITLLLTEIGKRWIGRLRPHFIAVCAPRYNSINCTSNGLTGVLYNAIYTGDSFCTGDSSAIKEARFSFPSGHSSYSWYCMVFLIFYIEARLILLRFRYIKPLVQMAAFIAAWVTCLSRVSDYHHRGSDVIGGTVIGWAVGLFIVFVVGKVLWEYEKKPNYSDFVHKPKKNFRL